MLTTPRDSQGTFSDAKDLGEIATGSPATGTPNRDGAGSDRPFSTNFLLYLRNGKI